MPPPGNAIAHPPQGGESPAPTIRRIGFPGLFVYSRDGPLRPSLPFALMRSVAPARLAQVPPTNNPATRRRRFIARTADSSALVTTQHQPILSSKNPSLLPYTTPVAGEEPVTCFLGMA